MGWSMKVDAEDEIRKEEKINIAKGMKKEGLQYNTIEKYTGLTNEEIEEL